MTGSDAYAEEREALRRACPQVPLAFLEEHVRRLPREYFKAFGLEDRAAHLLGLSGLSSGQPVRVLFDRLRDGQIGCTVLAFDHSGAFSLITGLLSGMGLTILSGDIFTYLPETCDRALGTGGRRRIVDALTGTLDTPLSMEGWAKAFEKELGEIFALLEREDPSARDEARRRVNGKVVNRLGRVLEAPPTGPFRVQLQVDTAISPAFTRVKVIAEDTPAFLYALSTAFHLHGVFIERVRIRTIGTRVEDVLDLVDRHGKKIASQGLLNRIGLAVLLTKHFTYVLGEAPDPLSALTRFEVMVEDLLSLPDSAQWVDILGSIDALRDLARVLGASDFLWEEFIRLDYERLLPLLAPQPGAQGQDPEEVSRRLSRAMETLDPCRDPVEALDSFKDKELFLILLERILDPEASLEAFSLRLTALAEAVLRKALDLALDALRRRYGLPRTVGGIQAPYALFGLGKLGSEALGHASDLELLLVYGDQGMTDGPEAIPNSEFFERLVKGVSRRVTARKEGIFRLDWRLRPFGNAGPWACSLETFCRYYGAGGQAHAYERLALVNLRAFGGDRDLGERVERLRDEMLYQGNGLDLEALHALRERQFQEKARGETFNAKFGTGGLVDLEYGVQVLQLLHGRKDPALRTPRIREAIEALQRAGILSEAEGLGEAYLFLRHLINGLRMLTGSSGDLFVPGEGTPGFQHLARRMGYQDRGGLEPEAQLRIDLEIHTARVRRFVERHFGNETLPDPLKGTVVDVILGEETDRARREAILTRLGFTDVKRASRNILSLAGKEYTRDLFSRLAVLACDILTKSPDPDLALNNWERLIHVLPSPAFHYGVLLSQPMRLDILLRLFSWSRFFADTLIRNPGFLDWIVLPDILHHTRSRGALDAELRRTGETSGDHAQWLNDLRRLRRREILRIGARDICLGVPVETTVHELSLVADAFVAAALNQAWRRVAGDKGDIPRDGPKERLCIFALGKLGGEELNYSSDIDLVAVYEPGGPFSLGDSEARLYAKVMEQLVSDLNRHTEEGYVYRVDLRLRPFGRSGELVPSLRGFIGYYRQNAGPWEIQAALRMRPVAGNPLLGHRVLDALRPILRRPRSPDGVWRDILRMREEAILNLERPHRTGWDIKNGAGGIRDIEFLVQGLQMLHAQVHPRIIASNTLRAMDILGEEGLLPPADREALRSDYLFLRRVEHGLQIYEDTEIHRVPASEEALTPLARRILGHGVTAGQFVEELEACLRRVRGRFMAFVEAGKGPQGE